MALKPKSMDINTNTQSSLPSHSDFNPLNNSNIGYVSNKSCDMLCDEEDSDNSEPAKKEDKDRKAGQSPDKLNGYVHKLPNTMCHENIDINSTDLNDSKDTDSLLQNNTAADLNKKDATLETDLLLQKSKNHANNLNNSKETGPLLQYSKNKDTSNSENDLCMQESKNYSTTENEETDLLLQKSKHNSPINIIEKNMLTLDDKEEILENNKNELSSLLQSKENSSPSLQRIATSSKNINYKSNNSLNKTEIDNDSKEREKNNIQLTNLNSTVININNSSKSLNTQLPENTPNLYINDKDYFLQCKEKQRGSSNSLSRKGITKSNSADIDRPVLHVQFDSGRSHSESTVPIKDQYSSPSSSLSSSSSSEDNSSIGLSEARAPDGGWGWVVVAASFMVNLIADGITFSFGVMYVEFLSYFGQGKSKTAWIGSLFMAMPLLSGPVASFLTDRYGCRKVTIVGSVLASVGFVISSFTSSMEVLVFTFGVVAGFGLSLCYVAAVVIVAYYFDKKRSLATGLSVCGSGIGTFIFAPLIQELLAEYGWRGTTLILAGFFLNLAVCGALMRDLPWTSTKKKILAEEKKRLRYNKRNKKNGSSADTFSVSNSTNTASAVQPSVDNNITDDPKQISDDRLFSSLVNLPTYVRNGEKVPVEVLELLSTNKNVYNVLLHNYPGLLTSSRSFSDSGRLNENHVNFQGNFAPVTSPLASEPTNKPTSPNTDSYLGWLKKTQSHSHHLNNQRKLPAYLRDLRVHRSSLTYRGAMLNIHRYRLRASSCPDIYRNSMTTIAKEKSQWYAGLWEFWDLLVDMLDFSHFAEPRFLLFAFSNFLLYTWYDVPYVYLSDYAVEMGYSDSQSSYLISIIGIVNMAGEILLGWAGDKTWVNPSFVYAVCMGLCGLTTALVPLLKQYWSLATISGAFGFFIAANYSLTSIILVELITLEKFTNAYGLLLLVQGVANLVGPPLAGWLYDITGTYDLSFYLGGFFIAASGALLVITPATKRYRYFQTLQRQASNVSESSVGVDCSSVKEPQFHSILASCITGSIEKEKKNEINHV